MNVTELVKLAFERGDLLGLFFGAIMLGLGLYVKMHPGSGPESKSTKPASQIIAPKADARLDSVVKQLETVDKRLGRVESDLEHMPTNKDFHEMEVKFERMSGRMISIERTTESTGRAVGRIEDFMLSMKRDK